MPNPLYGNKNDPGDAYRRSKAAYRAGDIDYETYKREIKYIRRIQAALDRAAEARARAEERRAAANKRKR